MRTRSRIVVLLILVLAVAVGFAVPGIVSAQGGYGYYGYSNVPRSTWRITGYTCAPVHAFWDANGGFVSPGMSPEAMSCWETLEVPWY